MAISKLKFVADPADLALWIAGPVPGDKDDNDCTIGGLDFKGLPTSNGVGEASLQNDERYCLQYFLKDSGKKAYRGDVKIYCDGDDEWFERILVYFTTKGLADGHECFRVKCGGE